MHPYYTHFLQTTQPRLAYFPRFAYNAYIIRREIYVTAFADQTAGVFFMQENYEHYISRNIRSLYRQRLIAPILYLVFVLVLSGTLSVTSVVFPAQLTDLSDMDKFLSGKDFYVSTHLSNLKFTGYTRTRFGQINGYYYYTENNSKDRCDLILLAPDTCEQGLPQIDAVTVHARILPRDDRYDTLLSSLAADLAWTDDGIRAKTGTCYLSEPDFKYRSGLFLFLILLIGALFAAVSVVCCILFITRPYLSPPCQMLRHFGKPKKLLAQAEEELATLPQLATEDMFITEHFFIETSRYGIAIVPIDQIIWIYKHSTLHKLFWYHFSISYTLNITANRHVYIHCPKNIKSDIDGIMDYLAEANHNILVGFSEENRRKVQAIQGDPLHLERVLAKFRN